MIRHGQSDEVQVKKNLEHFSKGVYLRTFCNLEKITQEKIM